VVVVVVVVLVVVVVVVGKCSYLPNLKYKKAFSRNIFDRLSLICINK